MIRKKTREAFVRGFLGAALLSVFLTAAHTSVRSEIPQTTAKQAFLIELKTGTIFVNKNADELMVPASMAKIMTMALVFKNLVENKITLEQKFPISENAWRKGGGPSRTTSMFAKLKSKVAVADLIRGVIIQSGNDAAIALAEGIYGSEAEMAKTMNKYARAIGMENSHFMNATGLPESGQLVSARDLALLAKHVIETYPQFLPIFSEKAFKWNKIFQRNRNLLIRKDERVDGLKTGYTENSGHGIVTTAKLGERRVILVLNGLAEKKDIQTEVKKFLDYAYEEADIVRLFDRKEVLGKVEVYGGVSADVEITLGEDFEVLIPKSNEKNELRARYEYLGPISAPIEQNAKVGVLKLYYKDHILKSAPIFAKNEVSKGSVSSIAKNAVVEWGISKFNKIWTLPKYLVKLQP